MAGGPLPRERALAVVAERGWHDLVPSVADHPGPPELGDRECLVCALATLFEQHVSTHEYAHFPAVAPRNQRASRAMLPAVHGPESADIFRAIVTRRT